MKRTILLFSAVCFLALLIAGLSLLVEGPVSEQQSAAPVRQQAVMIPAGERLLSEDTETNRGAEQRQIVLSLLADCRKETAVPPVSDRNGRPLSAGAYVRMVYEAFPPEGERG